MTSRLLTADMERLRQLLCCQKRQAPAHEPGFKGARRDQSSWWSLLFLSLIISAGCATGRVQFQFRDAGNGQTLNGVAGEWYEDYTRPFDRTIWTHRKSVPPSGDDGTTELISFNGRHLHFFRFQRPGYGRVDGYLSKDGFVTGPSQKIVPTNHVIVIPMSPEPSRGK